VPRKRLPVGLTLLENPIGSFGEISGYSAYGDSVALLLAGAFKEADDVLVPPRGVILLANDDIGGFDVGPLQVVVALLDHFAIVSLTGAGLHLGHGAGVACEVLGAREAVNRTQFAVDDDGEDLCWAGDGLDELDARRASDPLENASFQAVDVDLDEVEQFELLLHTTPGLLGEVLKENQELGAPLRGEDVTIGIEGEGVLGQGGMDAVLELGADLGEGHPGAGEFPLVAELARRNPHGGQGAIVEQDSQAVSVELIGLMDVTHHGFSLGSMSQIRHTASSFDLIHDPIPIADGLQSDRGTWWERGEKGLDGTSCVIDPRALDDLATTVENGEQGKVLAQP